MRKAPACANAGADEAEDTVVRGLMSGPIEFQRYQSRLAMRRDVERELAVERPPLPLRMLLQRDLAVEFVLHVSAQHREVDRARIHVAAVDPIGAERTADRHDRAIEGGKRIEE